MSRFVLKMIAVAVSCASLTFVTTPASSAEKAAKHAAKDGSDGHWTYTGKTGPQKWGDLEKEFTECKLGQAQSPIDIPDANTRKGDFPTLLVNYKPTAARVVDNGHTVQVNLDPGNSFTVGDKSYQLLQFHFHKPSEEKINGKAHDMVAHLVHKGADGKLAVIAVLLDAGADSNPALKPVFDNLPKEKTKEMPLKDPLDLVKLLPNDTGYYSFAGSLTTPPCSEQVTWFVLKKPSTLSADSLAKFGKIYPMNARPIQPLNGRDIMATR